MDAETFDWLIRVLAGGRTRRGLLTLLTGVPLVGPLAVLLDEESEAAKRRQQVHDAKKKGKKKKCAKAGQPYNKKKKCCNGLRKDVSGLCLPPPSPPTVPPPPPCVPRTCQPLTCGSLPDLCGNTLTCHCPSDHLCLVPEGELGGCQPCTVTCTGTPEECGNAFETALESAGFIVMCPGRYQGNFILNNDTVEIIGAGQGTDPGTNTILDAAGSGRALEILSNAYSVFLDRLRITGGDTSEDGAGILHNGHQLTMTDCTISGNTTTGDGGGIAIGDWAAFDWGNLQLDRTTVADNHTTGGGSTSRGGGIFTAGPNTRLTDCLVDDNQTSGQGGGIYVAKGAATLTGTTQVRNNSAPAGGGIWVGEPSPGITVALTIEETCRVMQNTAAEGAGGGIRNTGGTVTLVGADPSPIVVDNCRENCVGTVDKCADLPASCPP